MITFFTASSFYCSMAVVSEYRPDSTMEGKRKEELPETDPRSGEPHREEERGQGEEVHYGHHLCVKNLPVCLSLHETALL
jgi:hypothetical protein